MVVDKLVPVLVVVVDTGVLIVELEVVEVAVVVVTGDVLVELLVPRLVEVVVVGVVVANVCVENGVVALVIVTGLQEPPTPVLLPLVTVLPTLLVAVAEVAVEVTLSLKEDTIELWVTVTGAPSPRGSVAC